MPRTYTAKDPRLNQKVSLSSHVLDTKRKVGRSSLCGDCLTAHCAAGDVLLAAQGRLQLLDVDVPLDQGIVAAITSRDLTSPLSRRGRSQRRASGPTPSSTP